MYVVRNAVRNPLELKACLEIARDSEPRLRIPARTLDLSTHGVGLIAVRPVAAGQIVTIVIEDGSIDERSRKRQRRWRGHVVHSTTGQAGRRIGICFEEPECGPLVSFERTTRTRGIQRLRLDGPTTEPANPAETDHETPAACPGTSGARPFRSAALIGLGLDQLLKAAFSSTALGGAGHPLENMRDWSSIAMAVAGLGTAGLLARLAEHVPDRERPGVTCGLGLIVGALLSGLVDQLAFDTVRTIGSWPVSPAHLLAATGAALTVGSWVGPRIAQGESGSRSAAAPRPSDPGSPGLIW